VWSEVPSLLSRRCAANRPGWRPARCAGGVQSGIVGAGRAGLSAGLRCVGPYPRTIRLAVLLRAGWSGTLQGADVYRRVSAGRRRCDRAGDPRESGIRLAAAAGAGAGDRRGAARTRVRAAKRLALTLAGGLTWRRGCARRRAEIVLLIGSPNQVEAVTARFRRRDPVFARRERRGAVPCRQSPRSEARRAIAESSAAIWSNVSRLAVNLDSRDVRLLALGCRVSFVLHGFAVFARHCRLSRWAGR